MGAVRGALRWCVVLIGVIGGCARSGGPAWHDRSRPVHEMAWDGVDLIEARQRPGAVQWVLPAPAPLPLRTFGTPIRPQHTAGLPAGVPAAVRALIDEVPYLLGVPLEDRKTDAVGRFTTTHGPTPFGTKHLEVRGRIALRALDRRWEDGPQLFDTPDEIEARARFTDPAGNRYEIWMKRTIQPNLPGWQTGGGVLRAVPLDPGVGGRSPLEPRDLAHLVAWGIADVRVGGDWVERDRLVRLVATGGEGKAGEEVETSLLLWPVRATPEGLVHAPLELPPARAGEAPPPWVHVRFPQTRLLRVDPSTWAAQRQDEG